MKIVKDTPFEFGFLVWPVRPPRPSLTVVVKATFALPPEGLATLAEEQAPVTGEAYWDDDPTQSLRLDNDLAVHKPKGECFLAGTCHPPKRPATVSAVQFRIGSVAKRLAVFGDRTWKKGLAPTPSSPQPFESMPLRYELCFGGEGISANPVGRGPDGRLPNIEDPGSLVTSPSSKPKPVGAFPIPRTWKARMKKAGTYSDSWVKTRFPWFPDDFDWAYFNAAPEDQRIEGFWRGDEQIDLVNLHPEHARIAAKLPGLRARCFLVTDGEPFREVPLRLDTITVDADAAQAYCLWRGLAEVEHEKAEDVKQVFVMHEGLDDASPAKACRARYDAKIAEEEAEKAEAQVEAPPEPDDGAKPPEVAADPALLAALAEKIAAGTSLAGEDLTGANLAGFSFAGADLAGAVLAEAKLGKAKFENAKLGGAVLQGADLTGASFEGASLEHADFTGATGEKVSFAKANLEHAVLAGAKLPRARFTEARLAKADLAGAELPEADFSKAILDSADLSGAKLGKAKFGGASLVDTSVEGADLSGANLDEANLEKLRASEGASFEGASLKKVKAPNSRWGTSKLDQANLSFAVLTRADFSGASLGQAMLSGCELRGARFKEAKLPKASLLRANAMEADFESADLTEADLRGANLFGSEFWKSKTDKARLDQANLTRTKLAKR